MNFSAILARKTKHVTHVYIYRMTKSVVIPVSGVVYTENQIKMGSITFYFGNCINGLCGEMGVFVVVFNSIGCELAICYDGQSQSRVRLDDDCRRRI